MVKGQGGEMRRSFKIGVDWPTPAEDPVGKGGGSLGEIRRGDGGEETNHLLRTRIEC